mgnify:CR=1 FL=1
MKAQRFTGAVFICVIISFMCLSHASFVLKQVDKIQQPFRHINIDWEKLYPFEDVKTSVPLTRIESPIKYVKRKIEEYTSKFLIGYYSMVETAKKYEDIICWNMVALSEYNPVVRLHDGYLTSFTRSKDIRGDAESVKGLADFCKGKGVEFMYINLPVKIYASEDKDISGILDFSNQNADRFLSLLEKFGVKYYDFRKTLHDAGMNHHEAFYITDHHWKAETGLWAAGRVLEILRDNFGWPVKPEIVAPGNFRYEVYPDWFLGSHGTKLTLVRAKPEDFTLIYPKFETRIKFEVPDAGINTEGDLSITYEMRHVEPKEYYEQNPYAAYGHGDRPLIRIENKLIMNKKKVLVIHDSFSNSVIPFLATGLQYVLSIDLRYFTGSVKRFIEVEKPDAVIVMYIAGIPGEAPSSSAIQIFYDFR